MNILLVDDERLAVEVMNRMIDREKYGFSVIYKALSMKQAQQICEETDIDIIICDIEMPRYILFPQSEFRGRRQGAFCAVAFGYREKSDCYFPYQSCGFFVCTAGGFVRGAGLSIKAGGAGRYEPGIGEGS